MSDTSNTAPAQTEAAPAAQEAPASTAFDPNAFEARITSLMDERVKGFQRAISEKDSTIADLQRQLKTASMSEEEREQLAAQERQEADEALRLENALLKLGQQYPDEVRIVQKMLEGDTPEAYVTALHEALASIRSPQPEPETQVSDVDRNNPPSIPLTRDAGLETTTLPDGRVITREQALEILRSTPTLRG